MGRSFVAFILLLEVGAGVDLRQKTGFYRFAGLIQQYEFMRRPYEGENSMRFRKNGVGRRVIIVRPWRLIVWGAIVSFVVPLSSLSLAQDDFSNLDFESIYNDSTFQDPANDRADLNLSVDVDQIPVAQERSRKQDLNSDGHTGKNDRYVNWSRQRGNWEVSPVMLGRRQNGEAVPSDMAAPVGVEWVRDF